jgi:pimeloyl-ACP methyl ester carboxylesterase
MRSGRRPGRPRAVATVLVAAALSACSGSTGSTGGTGRTTSTDPPDATGTAPSPLEWSPCGELECATLAVPLDHGDPGGAQIELALGRRRASGERRGTVLVNPGGPGASGRQMPQRAPALFRRDVLEHFDVVGWDPRGVGASTAVDCVDDLDPFWALDRTPDSPAELEALDREARALARACLDRSGQLLSHLSSADSVADMEAIRIALADPQLTYVGYSYGTLLGIGYAATYPDRVRAMVLDSAVDPTLDFEDAARDQGVAFERALDGFLAWCDDRCDLGGPDPHDAFAALLERIDRHPIPAGGDRVLGPGETEIALAAPLYGGEAGYPVLAGALEDAVAGDPEPMLALADSYTGRRPDGSYDNQTEAFYATACLDGPAPASFDEVRALARRVGRDAPRLGRPGVWLALPCAHWPVGPKPLAVDLDGAGLAPIAVLLATRDPATPPKWGVAVARQLGPAARLVTLDADGHVVSGRGVACVDDAVADYLVDLTPPPDGLECG